MTGYNVYGPLEADGVASAEAAVTDPDTPPWHRAYAAYRLAHPDPAVTDFPCPRCHASRGEACPLRPGRLGKGHAARVDKWLRVGWRHHGEAVHAADRVADEARRKAVRS